ncbi:MAG TPA: PQQ-dependent dehydrogenase, methanol/ethanol family [Steroidobacteraceae bacterium]|nr:PQQ-dependent dehydrogenase, methanol/ethanol family [Steroidobacteraceae bacterium]
MDKDEPGSWLAHGRTWSDQRFSPLDQISTANVSGLGLAWSYELDVRRGQESTPLMADGVLYFSTSWSKVVALDARDGHLLWEFDPKVPGRAGFRACCDVVNRGVALWGDKVYVGTVDGRLIALNRETGQLVWSVTTTDPSKPYTITGAPRVANGKVFIGNGGAEYGVRGYVSAYDAQTGRRVWRFYTVPGNPKGGENSRAMRLATPTWHGRWWQFGGGGTVWDSMSVDPELNLLYVGVGNGVPWRQAIRSPGGGDNLFLSSIVALNADTGRYIWHYQTTPGDNWDFDATQNMVLAELRIQGKRRKVLMQANKNGFFYVLDRKSGEFLSAKNFVDVRWATGIDANTHRPIEVPAARYSDKPFVNLPSAFAAHNWHPMAYSPQTGWVYIPVMEIPFKYAADKDFQYRPGAWNLGVDMMAGALPDDMDARRKLRPQLKGRLIAWDPVAQREMWRVDHGGPANGGVLATAGGLVFQGTGQSRFAAYGARDGKKLWEFATQTGVIAPPITYSIDGEQYVAVLAGWGGGYAVISPFVGPGSGDMLTPRRMLVFRLGGTARLPPDTTVERPRPQLAEENWPAESVARGKRLFYKNCAVCHGDAAVGGRVIPDLRYSALLSSPQAWQAVVIGGALTSHGMVSFRRWLNEKDAQDVRAYVAGESKRLFRDMDREAVSR